MGAASTPVRPLGGSPRPTLSPEDWTRAATEVLVDQGIDHVRVDVLAGQLGVTRGSFYWHFRDREALLRSVLQTWRAIGPDVTALLSARRVAPPPSSAAGNPDL